MVRADAEVNAVAGFLRHAGCQQRRVAGGGGFGDALQPERECEIRRSVAERNPHGGADVAVEQGDRREAERAQALAQGEQRVGELGLGGEPARPQQDAAEARAQRVVRKRRPRKEADVARVGAPEDRVRGQREVGVDAGNGADLDGSHVVRRGEMQRGEERRRTREPSG